MIAQQTTEVVPVADLVPTQMTVGIREVIYKRRRWRDRSSDRAANYLNKLRIPVVLGPNGRLYLIDRHHLTLALHDEGIGEFTVSIVANLSTLSIDEFWVSLERQNWIHPFDDEGRRRCYDDMPQTIDSMKDDPFRSLAGAVKRAGGYAKVEVPFSEFKWADFLRCRIPRELLDRDFDRALAIAMNLARGVEAAALPGWRREPSSLAQLRPMSALGHKQTSAGGRTRSALPQQQTSSGHPGMSALCQKQTLMESAEHRQGANSDLV